MKTKRLRIRIAWAAAICAHLILLSTSALSQAPFYQGKTITLITGTTAGSQYDAHARLIAQHWGRHIPGESRG